MASASSLSGKPPPGLTLQQPQLYQQPQLQQLYPQFTQPQPQLHTQFPQLHPQLTQDQIYQLQL